MKQALTFLSATLAAAVLICPEAATAGGSTDFKALFTSNADKAKFYICEQGDSFESACSSLYLEFPVGFIPTPSGGR